MKIRQAWCAGCDGVALTDELGCIACRAKRKQRAIVLRAAPLAEFCAICIDGTIGLHRVQLEEGGPVHTACKRCDDDSIAVGYHGFVGPCGVPARSARVSATS